MRRRGDEAGDSLVEIVLALVIIGVVIGAFVATFSTGATASSTHRRLVTADVVLRNYAEQTKLAVSKCVEGGSYEMTYVDAEGNPTNPPDGFSLTPAPNTGANVPCPPATEPASVSLVVTLPNGDPREMSIEVRTP
jgi:type II secretory pathway pseudopilin PulG